MLMLISQDRLKAVDTAKIDFYYIFPDKNVRGKYSLQVKSPKFPADEGYYDFLNMFEHEDIQVVKAVMNFVIAFQLASRDSSILTIDLSELNKLGFERFFSEYSKTDFEQRKNSAE